MVDKIARLAGPKGVQLIFLGNSECSFTAGVDVFVEVGDGVTSVGSTVQDFHMVDGQRSGQSSSFHATDARLAAEHFLNVFDPVEIEIDRLERVQRCAAVC